MSAAKDKTMQLPVMERTIELTRDEKGAVRGFNREKRTVTVQFSSEAPVERWFGTEILDHKPGSVNMARVQNGAAVLLEHDTKLRVGITEGGKIDGKTGIAEVRFARTPLGDQVMNEVEDGTLRFLSVGYKVDKFEVDEDEEEYRATSWTPLEISFVGIPADPSAKVLRSHQPESKVMLIRAAIPNRAPAAAAPAAPAVPNEGDEPQLDADGNPIVPDEGAQRNQRIEAMVREVYSLAHKWQRQYADALTEAERCVTSEGDRALEVFRGWILEQMQRKQPEQFGAAVITDPKTRRQLSYGEAFCQTEQYKRFGKNIGQKRQVVCEIADRFQFRTTFSATTEALTSIQKLPGVPGILDQQPLFIADLFAQGVTGGMTVRYIQEDSYTNAATAVAEGSAKPEATLNVSEVDATVRKIAVWTKVTDEMMADFDQISSYINARLAYMVQAKEDSELLNGTGNSNRIKGVLNFTGIQTVSGAANPLDGIMKAISYVRGANGSGFGEPDAVVINPLDWMNMKLTKDTNQQYYGGGPFSGIYGGGPFSNVYTVWGLPAIVTNAIAQGTALVGAFRAAAQLFRRKGLSIESTNSDNDDFQKNLMTIRAEERLTLAVYQPNKFCTVTGIPSV